MEICGSAKGEHRNRSTAINVAITGRPEPGNGQESVAFCYESSRQPTHVIRITGTSDVQTLTPKPGISSSVKVSRCTGLPDVAYRFLSENRA